MASSSSETGVALWEWLNEYGRWRPYAPHVSQFIEHQFSSGGAAANNGFVSLIHADQSLKMYQLDFKSMKQTRYDTGTSRTVRRHVYSPESPAAKGVSWQWVGDSPNQWHSYDMDIACLLEDAHRKGLDKIDLSNAACKLPYVVDVQRLVQTRINTGFQRKIRRQVLTTRASTYSPTANGPVFGGTVSSTSFGSASTSASAASSFPFGAIPSSASAFVPVPTFGRSSIFAPSTSTVPGASAGASTFQPAPLNLSTASSGGDAASTSTDPLRGVRKKSLRKSGGKKSKVLLKPAATFSNPPPAAPFPVPPMGRSTASMPPTMPGGSGLPLGLGPMPSSSMPATMPFSSLVMPPMFGSGMPLPYMSSAPSNGMFGYGSMSQPGPSTAASAHVMPEKRSRMCSISNTASTTNAEGALKDYVVLVEDPPAEEDCCICCETLDSPSGYGGEGAEVVEKLRKCNHMFHKLCIHAMYNSGTKDGSLQCPTCKTMNGVKYGNCPPGQMSYCTLQQSLTGYDDCDTISIVYSVSPGTQTAGHPNPGHPYTARGFPRRGFLPNNPEGNKVLRLLVKAWERRLTFTVGSSATTGESDTVVWNEIHHKTEIHNHHGHGYPDPKYLENVTLELATQGVTEEEKEEEEEDEEL